jgi:hypothetical protein
MKLRIDFVTNSSSSSFMLLHFNNPTMARIFSKYPEMIEHAEEDCLGITVYDDVVEVALPDAYVELPYTLESAITLLLAVLSNNPELLEEDIEYNAEDDETDRVAMNQDIADNRQKILDDMQACEVSCDDMGWQGDSEARYDESNYSEEYLKEIYEKIAEENKCSVDEVTDEMFCEYVGDKVSHEVSSFTYSKEDGINTYSDFYIE